MPSEFVKDIDWEFNNSFSCIGGHRFWENGIINFPESDDNELTRSIKYVTVYGWSFNVPLIIYANTANNIKHGVSRHFKKKIMENDEGCLEMQHLTEIGIDCTGDYDNMLYNNQVLWLETYGRQFVKKMHSYVDNDYTFDAVTAAIDICNQKHKKKPLRVSALVEMKNSGTIVHFRINPFVIWKLKYIENAKFDKPPRIIVDCTVHHSLASVHHANWWKNKIDGVRFEFGRVVVVYFAKTTIETVSKALKDIEFEDFEIAIYHYSDDALIKINDVIYNFDIKSNDSLHIFESFDNYKELTFTPPDIGEIIDKIIHSPIKIYDPSNRDRKVIIQPLRGYLPSGIGDTTQKNNHVYQMLGYSLSMHQGPYTLSTVTQHGFYIGFRFSWELCPTRYHRQFLKHSLITNDVCMPNLGILFRYSGRVEGDLPKISYPRFITNRYHRFAYFQSLLTYGFLKVYRYTPYLPLCPFFEYLSRNESEYEDFLNKKGDNYIHHNYIQKTDFYIVPTTRQFYARYPELRSYMIEELESLIATTTIGISSSCEAIDIIMSRDYQLTWGRA